MKRVDLTERPLAMPSRAVNLAEQGTNALFDRRGQVGKAGNPNASSTSCANENALHSHGHFPLTSMTPPMLEIQGKNLKPLTANHTRAAFRTVCVLSLISRNIARVHEQKALLHSDLPGTL